MTTPLKSCPHCGAKNCCISQGHSYCYAQCFGCKMFGPNCDTAAEAAAAWNALPRPSDVAALQARAEAAEAERDQLAERVAGLEAAAASVDHTELRERLADLEHRQWAHWTRYLLTKMGIMHESGGLSARALLHNPDVRLTLLRWESQVNIAYSNLSESEKNSGRVWADKVLAIVKPAVPVEWREGVPMLADVVAHEERGGLWVMHHPKGAPILAWLYDGDDDGVLVKQTARAGFRRRVTVVDEQCQWRPCRADGTPAPWPVHPSETADDIDPVAMIEADTKFDRMGIVEVADAE